MLELDVRELRGDLYRRVHEAERGRKDHGAAGTGHALDGAFRIRAFRNAFKERRLDLVTEMRLQLLAADIMRLGPAAIRLGADIDEADLGLFLGLRAACKAAEDGGRGGKRPEERGVGKRRGR